MACFSFAWIENILIWAVVVIVLVAIIRLVLPHVFGASIPPGLAWVPIALNYVIWGAVLIFCIIVVFDLVQCALGGGGHLLYHR